jgi:hypothetical protein
LLGSKFNCGQVLFVKNEIVVVQLDEEAGEADLEVEDDEPGGRGSRRKEDDRRPAAERPRRQQRLQGRPKSGLNRKATAFQRNLFGEFF